MALDDRGAEELQSASTSTSDSDPPSDPPPSAPSDSPSPPPSLTVSRVSPSPPLHYDVISPPPPIRLTVASQMPAPVTSSSAESALSVNSTPFSPQDSPSPLTVPTHRQRCELPYYPPDPIHRLDVDST